MDTDVDADDSDESEATRVPCFNRGEVRESHDRVQDKNGAYLCECFHHVSKAWVVWPVVPDKDEGCKWEEGLTHQLIYHILGVVDDSDDKKDSSLIEKKSRASENGHSVIFSTQIHANQESSILLVERFFTPAILSTTVED